MMQRSRRTTGFTLMEVILALGLAVAVMAAMGTAIFVHLRAVDKTRVAIERDQLARVLLRYMSNDLRAAVRREPFDDSALKAMLQGAKSAGGRSSGGGSSGQSNSQAGSASGSSGGNSSSQNSQSSQNSENSSQSSGSSQSSSSSSGASGGSSTESSSSTTSTTPPVAGVYGTAYDLQVDIARVPRPDEINTALAAGAPVLGDIKTVYYFLASAATGVLPSGATGLMRSEMNRAQALYASQNGNTDVILQNAQPLAVEVVGLEFRYFDGTQWLTEWDSQASNGLPLAIEIAVAIPDPLHPIDGVPAGSLFDPLSGIDPDIVFRTLVQLPNAQLSSSTSGSSTSGAESTSGSSSSNSSSSGSGGSSSGSSTSGGS
jgi:uncharacterized membrane protein YgcG